ncbi:hypothetical protein NC653_037403 [Populus alba x Populus x berolinensis]|uniref:Uncharacterized protein n=1 Tax=Populus alba x Populus x berolinensis TaxID=444605 RepID=A0AAD6PRX7_9ROSI|nr:hypothetical protein NC653_037403 [Populus alba x Populus x berolinensis]
MENVAQVIKGFILSIPESVSPLWHRARQLASRQLPPSTINQEEELMNMFQAKQEMEWQKFWIKLQFSWQPQCFSSPFQSHSPMVLSHPLKKFIKARHRLAIFVLFYFADLVLWSRHLVFVGRELYFTPTVHATVGKEEEEEKEEGKRKEEERKRGLLGRRGCGCCDEVVRLVVAAVELEEDGVGFLLQRKKEEEEKSAEFGRKCCWEASQPFAQSVHLELPNLAAQGCELPEVATLNHSTEPFLTFPTRPDHSPG